MFLPILDFIHILRLAIYQMFPLDLLLVHLKVELQFLGVAELGLPFWRHSLIVQIKIKIHVPGSVRVDRAQRLNQLISVGYASIVPLILSTSF